MNKVILSIVIYGLLIAIYVILGLVMQLPHPYMGVIYSIYGAAMFASIESIVKKEK